MSRWVQRSRLRWQRPRDSKLRHERESALRSAFLDQHVHHYLGESTDGRRLLVHLAHDITQQKKTDELAQRMLDLSHQLAEIGETAVRPSPAAPLSEQEKQILRLFAEGKSSRAVAKSLGISTQTLRNHLHHINQKLRTHNRLEAVMNAIHRKLI